MFPVLPTTSAPTCLQHSRNLGPIFCLIPFIFPSSAAVCWNRASDLVKRNFDQNQNFDWSRAIPLLRPYYMDKRDWNRQKSCYVGSCSTVIKRSASNLRVLLNRPNLSDNCSSYIGVISSSTNKLFESLAFSPDGIGGGLKEFNYSYLIIMHPMS